MIVLLVLFILIFVFFALFIGNNLSNICNFWFFKTYQQVPAAVLVLISFAMGIAFAVLVFIIGKVKQNMNIEIETTRAEKTEKANRRREKKEMLEQKERSFRKNKKSAVACDLKHTEANVNTDNKK